MALVAGVGVKVNDSLWGHSGIMLGSYWDNGK